jgi:CheY-like chemotaxis protein
LLTNFFFIVVHCTTPLKILLAEDNLTNQKIIKKIICSLSHECHVANNGLEAFKNSQKNEYDLIFMDLMMPVMGGIDSARKIRRDEKSLNRRTPIVALTASVDTETRASVEKAGMDEFVSKPVTLQRIAQVINKYSTNEQK